MAGPPSLLVRLYVCVQDKTKKSKYKHMLQSYVKLNIYNRLTRNHNVSPTETSLEKIAFSANSAVLLCKHNKNKAYIDRYINTYIQIHVHIYKHAYIYTYMSPIILLPLLHS